MRLSTSMMSHNSITGMLRKQTELANTSNQMGSGKRVLSPSDDPIASSMAFNAKNKLADITQYGKNIDYSRKSMQTTESTLGHIHDRLQRVRQLAIQANSDAIGIDGRKTIGLEIKEITGQLAKMMNTRDESGNYIFAGSKVTKEPFAQQNDGSYLYQGDNTERKLQISDTAFVSPFVSGTSVFTNIDSSAGVRSYAGKDNSSTETIVSAGSPGFLSAEKIGEYNIEFDGTNWQITSPHGQSLTDFNSNGTSDLSDLADYINQDGGNITLTPPAAPAPQAGDKFTVVFDNAKEDLLTGMQRFERALSGFDEEKYQRDTLNDVIAKADRWLESVADARSTIGTRRNGMDTIKGNNEDLQLYLKENVSSLEDLDYAEATGRFVLQQTALSASQQTFSKISQLSLFNYIR
ncbi:flagellar hook-associated protein 3 FlgL [Oceanospirillum multiglobuliferum]|uniref:Flagellar hook-associated protein 3 n=1 Tax=Oceanospirillum multiglobuliferum TaxID=64969 RepID=A0A1T4RJH4_9GAMM|nr:flagellar hook-associated protein FlgL [Oceanospirillum multiglobuliferum]OPX54823.1 flagellar hook-associated protein 3 [Oceanospirillum multiglobuliferum]SKA16135.1 flagellar hook-associated protein 3 FlgL [Oceanospirillum multiglobuliferum]